MVMSQELAKKAVDHITALELQIEELHKDKQFYMEKYEDMVKELNRQKRKIKDLEKKISTYEDQLMKENTNYKLLADKFLKLSDLVEKTVIKTDSITDVDYTGVLAHKLDIAV